MAVYYDEAKKSWYCKFRYNDWTGKSRHTTKRGFRTKREAKAYELDFKRSVTNSPDMTVQALYEMYMNAMKGRHRESTLHDKKCFYENHVLNKIGTLPLSSVTPSVVSQWQSYLLTQVAPGTAKSGNAKLNAMLNYAVKMGWMEKNPLSIVGGIGKTSRKTGFWTFEEYQRFREALQKTLPKDEVSLYLLCFDVLFFSGLRVAEFLGLGIDDIDGNIIHVRKAANRFDNNLKNDAARRDVAMPPSVMNRVHEYISRLPERPKIGLFMVSNIKLRIRLKLCAKEAGIPYISVHGLRHSHVSHLVSMGIPITVISKRIGHASPNVTLRIYSHMYADDSENVSRQLEMLVNCWSNGNE